MKHPSQEILALQASGDLGLVQRWKTKLHLEGCPACDEDHQSLLEFVKTQT